MKRDFDRLSAIANDEVILVAGATGQTGQLIVSGLQNQRQNVRGMVRNIERARSKLGDDIVLVEANVTKPEAH